MGSPEEWGVSLVPDSRLLWCFPREAPTPGAEALEAGPQQEGGDPPEVPRLGRLGTRRARGPAGARSLGAARAVGTAGLAASPGPHGCPGYGAEDEALLTQSSGPAELLPPWPGQRCLLGQGCRVAAAKAALDATETAPERAQEQQHPERRHLLQEASAPATVPKGPYCGHYCL